MSAPPRHRAGAGSGERGAGRGGALEEKYSEKGRSDTTPHTATLSACVREKYISSRVYKRNVEDLLIFLKAVKIPIFHTYFLIL